MKITAKKGNKLQRNAKNGSFLNGGDQGIRASGGGYQVVRGSGENVGGSESVSICANLRLNQHANAVFRHGSARCFSALFAQISVVIHGFLLDAQLFHLYNIHLTNR